MSHFSLSLVQGQEDNMWKLYIMRMNGTFKCFRCNAAGISTPQATFHPQSAGPVILDFRFCLGSWFDFQNKILKGKGMDELGGAVSPGAALSGATAGEAGLPVSYCHHYLHVPITKHFCTQSN